MVIVRGTRRLLDRLGGPSATEDDTSTTVLGDWYATLLRRRSPIALFVNEATLLPVLVRLAPARTLVQRFRTAAAETLVAHGINPTFIDTEIGRMSPAGSGVGKVAVTDC